ncbi:putative zinc finger protein [Scheffersomyces coipomensis]|uniref:putative zinc finger protein n=1 Tax=Scheffersomyces coipomensis TaxID=1788519 RepID=UPI00315D3B7A
MHLSPQLQQQQPQPQQQPPKRESVSKPDSDSTRASQSGMEISVIDTGKSASPTDNKVYSLREPTPPSIPLTLADRIQILTSMIPGDIEEYSAHLHKIAVLLYADEFEEDPKLELELREKFYSLMDYLPKYVNHQDPIHSKLYLLVEGNFDIFIKLSTNHANVDISTKTIRFLTNILMSLNYWEIYNLLIWKPVIYHFLSVIHFDINECYKKFIRDYSYYEYKKLSQPDPLPRPHRYKRNRRSTTSTLMNGILNQSPGSDSYVDEEESSGIPGTTSFFSLNPDTADHDKFVSASLAGLTPKEKKKIRVDAKLAAHRIIKKTTVNKPSNKSSNYDPDVVHECQLPSADEPHKLCLRRFSRKYELIRHQETVHSKKKKLFKCYVCVKQHPGVGPRIFTRHDTLAKHIRVNHKISGKEAKAEVAYSKKHAEVVEEGDITVHVGRRKTKVDFELRAHMEKKKNGMIDGDESGYLDSDIDSGDEDDEEEISLTSSQPPPPPQHQQPPPPPPPPKRAEYTFINNTA